MNSKTEHLEFVRSLGSILAPKLLGPKDEDEDKLLERIIQNLVSKLDRTPAEVSTLRKEANSLNHIADFLEKFASDKEKQKNKEVSKKDIEKIKETLMAVLGIKAEMVDILLKSANPDELRAVAANIRKEAEKRLNEAELIYDKNRASILTKISELRELETSASSSHIDLQSSLKWQALKAELARMESEKVLKNFLETGGRQI